MREHIAAMLAGPGAFRVLVQPAIAIALGILHGLRDRRAGRPPYLLELYQAAGDRARRLREGLRDVVVPIGLAALASLVCQYIIRPRVYLAYAIVYALVFVAIPYFVTRALTNRIARRFGGRRGVEASRDKEVPQLRCPGELGALAFCIAVNFVVFAACVALVFVGTDWLVAHPFIAKHVDAVRAALVTVLVAGPATIVGRQASVQAARSRGVRVGKDQFPELHEQFVRACRKLGVDPMPALYLSKDCGWPAAAHSASKHRSVVLIDSALVDEHWTEHLDWLTFVVAGALGSLRLGHTRWWVEFLTVYARLVPQLRTPLLVKWVQSRDRCAAFVVPDGIRGLVVEAVGREALGAVEMAPFLRQTAERGDFWERIDTMRERRPSIVARARALYDAGFFDRARDFERWSHGATPSTGE
ncbi:MAG TPA: hypothetical protein VK762_14975 [Polyangiaceae bacterium]|nr:hypothetical protein [Polyangiaceae bacterium]